MAARCFIEVHKLIIEGATRVEIFTYRPENVDRDALGGLYIVGEIEIAGRPEPNDLFILNSLASVLKREYYATLNDNPALSLEEALKAANAAFGNLALPSATVRPHMVVAALSSDTLHFARVGDALVFLVRNGTWLNLARLKKPPTNHKKRQLFTNIISGRVQASDSVMIATPALAPFLQQDQLRRRLLNRPFEEIAPFLEKLIGRSERDISVGLVELAIHATNPQKPDLEISPFEPVAEPLPRNTQPLLPNQTVNQLPQVSRLGRRAGVLVAAGLAKSRMIIREAITGLKPKLKRLIKAGQKLAASKSAILTAPAKKPLGFLMPTKKTKIPGWAWLGLAAVVIVIGLALWLPDFLKHEQQTAAVARLKNAFEAKVSEITSRGQTTPADWDALKTTVAQLQTLPDTQALARELATAQTALRNKLTGTISLEGVTSVLNRADLGLKFQGQGIVMSANDFIAYDAATLVRASLAKRTPSFAFLPELIDTALAMPDPDTNGQTIYIINKTYLTKGTAYQAKTSVFTPLALLKPYDEVNIVAGSMYNGSIYLLDAAKPQVLKYNPAKPTLAPTLWLAPDAARGLRPAALAVDGTVFIAQAPTANGTVISQYVNGKLGRQFTIPPLEINQVTKMLTQKNDPNLYLLDASLGKILIINKATGKINRRFGSEALVNARDFTTIDAKTAYVLTDNAVLAVAIP